MKITVMNITKRLQVTFLSSDEYRKETGRHPNSYHYVNTSATTGLIWLQSWSGLMSGGASVSNTTLKAINTNGEFFAGNSWGPTSFSLKFKGLNDETFQRLNECIKYKNEPLYIEVETSKKYYMWCVVEDGSGIEFGELTFLSALDGTGTYWSTGDEYFNWTPNTSSGLVQSGPQNDLGSYTITKNGWKSFFLSKYITGEQFPIIKLEIPWIDFELVHANTGAVYSNYSNTSAGPQVYVFNSRDQTTTYNGVNVNYIVDYFMFTGGEELLELRVKSGTSTADVDQIKIEVTYENLHSTVY